MIDVGRNNENNGNAEVVSQIVKKYSLAKKTRYISDISSRSSLEKRENNSKWFQQDC